MPCPFSPGPAPRAGGAPSHSLGTCVFTPGLITLSTVKPPTDIYPAATPPPHPPPPPLPTPPSPTHRPSATPRHITPSVPLLHRPNQTVRRGCDIHAVPAT